MLAATVDKKHMITIEQMATLSGRSASSYTSTHVRKLSTATRHPVIPARGAPAPPLLRSPGSYRPPPRRHHRRCKIISLHSNTTLITSSPPLLGFVAAALVVVILAPAALVVAARHLRQLAARQLGNPFASQTLVDFVQAKLAVRLPARLTRRRSPDAVESAQRLRAGGTRDDAAYHGHVLAALDARRADGEALLLRRLHRLLPRRLHAVAIH
jgi:hypothetical protein